jgi:hypothetical protein
MLSKIINIKPASNAAPKIKEILVKNFAFERTTMVEMFAVININKENDPNKSFR